MNALIRKIAALTLAAASTTALGACAGSFAPRTDMTSPVAPQVQALVEANRRFPRWEDFPRSEEPAPQPVAIAAQVNTLRATGGALAGEVSRIDWQTTGDPAEFVAGVRARVDATPVAPVTAETAAEIEDFARRTRERGTAPPPVDPRQRPQ